MSEALDVVKRAIDVLSAAGVRRNDGQPITEKTLVETLDFVVSSSTRLQRENALLRQVLKEVL